MKNLIVILFLIYATSTKAGEGIVVVLETPLFLKQNTNSKIMQNVRKGEKIYIHKQHFKPGPGEVDYNLGKADDFGIEETDSSKEIYGLLSDSDIQLTPIPLKVGFYRTSDKNGRDVFVLKKHIKLIYNDSRESQTSISPYHDKDETDYRLLEPIPENYPLQRSESYRAMFAIGAGPQRKINYKYVSPSVSEAYKPRYGITGTYTKKLDFDNDNRLYFGGMFHLYNATSNFLLANTFTAEESKDQIGIGPYFSYDFHRTFKFRVNLYGSISVNYERYLVKQEDNGTSESKTFSGMHLSPIIGLQYERIKIFPTVNFIASTNLELNLPYTLKTDTNGIVDRFWQDSSNTIDIPFGAQFTVFAGISSDY
jgi:hypothetical protein